MKNSAEKVTVIGGGSWATAIIKMLSENLNPENIFWWMRNEETAAYIRKFRHNPNYLSSVDIKVPSVNIISDLAAAVNSASILVFAVPAAFLKDALKSLSQSQLEGKKIVSAIKGIIPDENLIIGEFFHQHYHTPLSDIAVISGPCHAEEVALEKLSYLTIASQNIALAECFAGMVTARYINTNLSDDIYGTEYAAVLKNIYAIASGICHGIGYGDNFQAVLISNALREMKNFLDVVHPVDRDIKESVYMGDLLVTAYSQFSRNRTFGNMIGKGYTATSAQLEMNMIAEGYYAVKSLYPLVKEYEINMPIFTTVYSILYEKQVPQPAMQYLTDFLS